MGTWLRAQKCTRFQTKGEKMPGPNGWTIKVQGSISAYPPSFAKADANGTLTLYDDEQCTTVIAGPWPWGQWAELNPTNLPESGGV